jgi:hypothetical protein
MHGVRAFISQLDEYSWAHGAQLNSDELTPTVYLTNGHQVRMGLKQHGLAQNYNTPSNNFREISKYCLHHKAGKGTAKTENEST